MPKVAAIIVSWNCREALAQCLESLRRHAPEASEIIVVDNASADGTPETIAGKFPKVRLMAQKENLGFAMANNLAMTSTDAPYLFVLNPDTVVMPGALMILLEFMENNPDAGLTAPLLLDADEKVTASTFRFPNLWRYWMNHSLLMPVLVKTASLFGMRKKAPRNSKPVDVDWATGAAFLVRREALGDQPLFDERFFMYSEDADLCKRLEERNWKRYLVPSAKIQHLHRGSSRKAMARTIYHLFNSMDLYYARHRSGPARFFLRLSVTVDMFLRVIILKIYPGGNSPENRQRLEGYLKVICSLAPFRSRK